MGGHGFARLVTGPINFLRDIFTGGKVNYFERLANAELFYLLKKSCTFACSTAGLYG
jgi:hypothetical protein